jgi:hypothetical protein
LYSTDTPAASISHDKTVVDMLVEAASSELQQLRQRRRDIDRPTRSVIASSLPALPAKGAGGTRGDEDYFLSASGSGRWGGGGRVCDPENKGRNNLWTTMSTTRLSDELLKSTSPTRIKKSTGNDAADRKIKFSNHTVFV